MNQLYKRFLAPLQYVCAIAMMGCLFVACDGIGPAPCRLDADCPTNMKCDWQQGTCVSRLPTPPDASTPPDVPVKPNKCQSDKDCGIGTCSNGKCQCPYVQGVKLCPSGCRNTMQDDANCGGCGKKCGKGSSCVAGVCRAGCRSGEFLCGATCVDGQTDRNNCGACGKRCSANAICLAGRCASCPQTICGDVCTDLSRDPNHCGRCGSACLPGQLCASGRCFSSCPKSLPTKCGRRCVDTQNDDANCGGCGNKCGSGQSCQAGKCQCSSPSAVACGGSCVDIQTDPNHCGRCGLQCAPGTFCSGGRCTKSCPAALPKVCGGSCVDLQTNAAHCGACGNKCGAGQSCRAGKCQCSSPSAVACSGRCVDLQTDVMNCGRCGNLCAAGTFCASGRCVVSCPAKLPTACAGSCVDLQTNTANCGRCGTQCASGERCVQGQCQQCPGTSVRCGGACCGAGQTCCNNQCIDTQRDPFNCGQCGKACWTGLLCQSGTCQSDLASPMLYKDHKKVAGYVTAGNTMMSASPPGNVNDVLLPQSSASIKGIPAGHVISGAYLFWSGSLNATMKQPDRAVQLLLPSGTKAKISAELCVQRSPMGGSFYCRKDITSLVKAEATPSGSYTLSDLQAAPGDCLKSPQTCQANFAGWAMVVVHEAANGTSTGHVLLYDSFMALDEQPQQVGIRTFSISGFAIKDPKRASLTFFGLEGDAFLGAPPEPANFADFIEVKSNTAATATRLQSATPNNPPGNIWNSTIGLGIDLDTFPLGQNGLNVFKKGDVSLQVTAGSGDGVIPGGNGELVYLGFIVLGVNL